MAEFGWAYIGGGAVTASLGPEGSIQFKTGDQEISGSDRLLFLTASNRVHLSGTLTVSGAISASNYIIDNIHVIDSSGSTTFGETNDDIHARTGSFIIASASSGAGSAGTTILSASISSVAGRSFVYASQLTVNKTPRLFIPSASIEWDGYASGSSLFLDSNLRVSGGVTLGDASADVITIVGTATSSAEALYNNNVHIADDKKLFFGTGRDASFEYDEDGTDRLLYAGANIRISDDVKLEFGTGGDASFEYDEDGTDTVLYTGANLRFTDDVKLEFGTGGSSSIEFNGNGDDYLVVSGTTSGVAISGTNIVLDGAVTLAGNTTLGNAAADVVTSTAQFTASEGGTFNSIVGVSDKITHVGDVDTFIHFTDDDINFQAGGVNFLDLTEDTQNEVTFNEGGVDVDFRVETADESHMLFIEGSSNRMSIGDNTGSPGATLEIKNHASAGATGVPLLQLNNNDTDQQCVDINASNIDANVVNVTANAVTTARVLAIGADGLTTGNALYVDDNSADTSSRKTALIIQNNAAATGAMALTVQSDGGTTGIKLDKNYSSTDEASVVGLDIDFDKTGASTTNNNMYGIQIDMDNTTATNGANYMYGLHVTPTLTHAANAGSSFVYGALINAQGGTNGTSLVQGARIEAGGGDTNFGIQLDVEDGGVDLRIESSADNGDYFQIQTTTHGATTFTTVDDNATAAHLTFTVDGDINLNPAGDGIVVDDDKKLYFGAGKDAYIEYNEDGDDALTISGSQTTGLVISGNVYVPNVVSGTAAGVNSLLAVTATGKIVLTGSTGGGGSGTPGGADTQIQYNNDGAFAGIAVFTWDDTNINIADDTKLRFGNGADASFEYDENGTDTLLYAGASMRFSDDVKLEFGLGGDASIEYNENGDDALIISGSKTTGLVLSGTNLVIDTTAGVTITNDLFIGDDKKVIFGAMPGDGYIEYNENGDDALIISGSKTTGLVLSGTNLIVDTTAGMEITGHVFIADDKKVVFGALPGDAFIEYDENGDDVMIISGSKTTGLVLSGTNLIVDTTAGMTITNDLFIGDDKKVIFGAMPGDGYIEYNENGDDALIISGSKTTGLVLSGTNVIVDSTAGMKLKAGSLQLADLGTAGATPASGFGGLYVNGDELYFIDDGGTSVQLGAAGPGTNNTWTGTNTFNDTLTAGNELTASNGIHIQGGVINKVSEKTANFTVASTDYILLCNVTGAVITGTLPTAVGRAGQTYIFKDVSGSASTNNIVLTGSVAGQTIDGADEVKITSNSGSVTIISNGNYWYIIGTS